jgi:hypothetical protein
MKRGTWLLVAAVVAYLVGVMVWVRYDRRSIREVFDHGSIFNTGDEGLSLAYGYLRAREAGSEAVATLRQRADPVSLPARAVLFRVRPSVVPFLLPEEEEEEEKDGKDAKDKKDGKEKPEKDQKAAKPKEDKQAVPLLTAGEEAWVRGGGRLVLAIDEVYGPLWIDEIKKSPAVRKVFPLWPGLVRFQPAGHTVLTGPALAAAHAVVLAGEAPIVARIPLGTGEVFLLSCPEILQNKLLGKGDHLALLEALAGVAERRPVRFDERAHGLGDTAGVVETLGNWGLGPLLLLGFLGAVAGVWRAGVRIGPADREDRDTRSEAVELLDSLADLYDRALDPADALRLYRESFAQTVAAETGLRGPALEARVQQLLQAAGPTSGELSRERFDHALATLNQAFGRLQDAKRK